MKPSSDSHSSKPSLEALLRLKREERPDEAFWSDFEVRLRQKQLAAIIEPKPWWLGASFALRRFSLPALLVTSGAAAVFTLVAVRNVAPVNEAGFASIPASEVGVSTTESAGVTGTEVSLPVPALNAYASEGNAARVETLESVLIASVVEPALSSSSSVVLSVSSMSEVTSVTASSEDSDPAINTLADSGSAMNAVADADVTADGDTSPAVGMAAAASEPVLVADTFPTAVAPFELASRDFTSVSWTPERVILQEDDFGGLATAGDSGTFAFGSAVSGQAGETVLPDAVVPAPGSRFERLLSADTPKVVASSGAFAQVRDRVLHHLGSDEELYASVSRLGVGGDRLSLRF